MICFSSIRSKLIASVILACSLLSFSCTEGNSDITSGQTGDGTPVSEITVSIIDPQSENGDVVSAFELMKGRSKMLNAVIMKGGQPYTEYKSVTWNSSNENICSVVPSEDNMSCEVTGTVSGNEFIGKMAIVSVQVDTGNGIKSSSVIVTAVEVQVTGVEIKADGMQTDESGRKTVHVDSGRDVQLDAIVSPEDATLKDVVWESGDNNVAVVDNNGLVRALKPSADEGVRIVARSKSNNEIYGECYIIVDKVYAKEIEFDDLENGQTLEIDINDTYLIDVYLYPENVTEKNIIWVFDDEVVTVTNGLISPNPGSIGKISLVTAKVQKADSSYLEYTINVSVTGLQPGGGHEDIEDGGNYIGQ